MNTTAIYPNRQQDKLELENKLLIEEFGNTYTEFYIPKTNILFAKGYVRIVYGDHGPYLEFSKEQLRVNLISKFNKHVDFENLPLEHKSTIYYYFLYPENYSNIKVYFQIKPVWNIPNAPKRKDGKKSDFRREEGYADYKRGFFYIDPYELTIFHPRASLCQNINHIG